MKYIQGQDRKQTTLFPVCLEDSISANHEVRLIDVFVDSLDLQEFGFEICHQENGRPAYHPGDLLKLYIYSYLNKVRSSRSMEKECGRNIEVIWLLKHLRPDHNTISNFKRDNPKAIKKVFRETVRIAKYFELIGSVLIAGDSTKLRAQNSKKNNFNQKKIDRHIEYIENKLIEYERALSESDGDDKQQIKQDIQKYKQRKDEYKKMESQLKETGEPQISRSDPDSRQMITRNNITEVAYNIQTTVDAKNKLLIDYKVTNTNDSKAMGDMLCRAKSILGTNEFIALYDKGYHTGSEFAMANKLGIETMVAIPNVAAQSPNAFYNVENFTYCKDKDHYICPENQILTTTGKLHQAKTYKFKRYITKSCISCRVKSECSKAKYGKAIQRSEFQEYIEQNKIRIANNKVIYRRRKSIVEHPYGTIKRQWRFSYIMTKKTKVRANADVGLIMIAYNLRRIINILGVDKLRKYIEHLISCFLLKYSLYKQKISILRDYILERIISEFLFTNVLKRLYLTQNTTI